MLTRPLAPSIKAQARELGFSLVGITDVRGSAHAEFYRSWLERGLHGSMDYLARQDAVERRTRPDAAWPELRSAIVVAMPYDAAEPATSDAIVARYARGRDYHRVMKSKIMTLLRWLEVQAERELPAARAYVDTGPVLERELAQRAGLGWFGRNTMLINQGIGSYFFLGALLVELELEADAPFTADRCGTCTRCISACPTGALLGRDATGAPVMDATRCISYLTIEQRGPIPRELRPLIGNRVYGCDICQEVCPWNGRAASDAPAAGAPSLVDLAAMTYEEWDAYTRGSAMRRAGHSGLRRNALVALGNLRRAEDVPVLCDTLGDPDPLVRSHAAWALGRIGGAAARAALEARYASSSAA